MPVCICCISQDSKFFSSGMRICLPIISPDTLHFLHFLPYCFFCMRPLVALLPGNLQFHCALQAPHASVRRVQGRLRCIMPFRAAAASLVMRPLVAYYFLKVLPPNSLALGKEIVYPSCGCVVSIVLRHFSFSRVFPPHALALRSW